MLSLCLLKNVDSLAGKALRLCLLSLALGVFFPRGAYAECGVGQTPAIPSYSFSVPGPDWYRSGCATGICVNYYGESAVNYFGEGGVRYANYAVTSTCPTGCCYQPCGGTLDEYQDGTLLAGGAVGWLANGVPSLRAQ